MTGSPLEAIEASLEEIRELALAPHTGQAIYEKAGAALEIVRGVSVPTAEQKAVLDFIRCHYEEHEEMPTYREMRDGLGYASSSAPHRLVMQLVNRGLIRLGRSYTARSLRLVVNDKSVAARE